MGLRATSHMRLRTRDHYYISSTLFGGKGGACLSSLHITIEGSTEYVTADGCKVYMDSLHAIEWIMFHDHLGCFQKPSLGGGPHTNLGDHGTQKCWFVVFYHV